MIDVAIPADRKAAQQEVKYKLKYKSLCIERGTTKVETEMYD